MCKEHFIKHKTGYLVGLVIALFAVATVLLARAGYLGESAFNLTGDIGRFGRTGVADDGVRVMPKFKVAPKVMPKVSPTGIQDPEIQRIAPESGKVAPTGKVDPVTGKVLPLY